MRISRPINAVSMLEQRTRAKNKETQMGCDFLLSIIVFEQ
jgi:hypothetical protein